MDSSIITSWEFRAHRKPVCIALLDSKHRVVCIPKRLIRVGDAVSDLIFLPVHLLKHFIVETDSIPLRAVMKYVPIFEIDAVELRQSRRLFGGSSRYLVGSGKVRAVYTGSHFIAMTADKNKCISPVTCLLMYPAPSFSGVRGVVYFKKENLFLTIDDYTREYFKNYKKFYKYCRCRLLQLVGEFPIYVCSSFNEVVGTTV